MCPACVLSWVDVDKAHQVLTAEAIRPGPATVLLSLITCMSIFRSSLHCHIGPGIGGDSFFLLVRVGGSSMELGLGLFWTGDQLQKPNIFGQFVGGQRSWWCPPSHPFPSPLVLGPSSCLNACAHIFVNFSAFFLQEAIDFFI